MGILVECSIFSGPFQTQTVYRLSVVWHRGADCFVGGMSLFLLVSYLVDSNWKIDIKGKIWGNFAWPRTIWYQVQYSTFSNTQHTQHYFRFHCTVFNNNIQQGPKVWSTLKIWDLKSNLGTFKTFSTTSLLQIKDLVLSGSLITGCIWSVNLKRAFPTQFVFMEIPGRLLV